jgi:hypothetical protein
VPVANSFLRLRCLLTRPTVSVTPSVYSKTHTSKRNILKIRLYSVVYGRAVNAVRPNYVLLLFV